MFCACLWASQFKGARGRASGRTLPQPWWQSWLISLAVISELVETQKPQFSCNQEKKKKMNIVLSPKQKLGEEKLLIFHIFTLQRTPWGPSPALSPFCLCTELWTTQPHLASQEHCKFLNGGRTVGKESKWKILDCDYWRGRQISKEEQLLIKYEK